MRKLWLIIPGLLVAGLILVMTTFATPQANADNGPHVQHSPGAVGTDSCAGCHRLHRGVNATLNTDPIETLCLLCHSGPGLGSDLDVMDGSDWGTGGALRAGGFDYARINTADPSLATPVGTSAPVVIGTLAAPGGLTQSKHNVGATPQTIWGNGPINAAPTPGKTGYELSCTSCHDPHGNGNYRILRAVPDGSGAPTPGYAVPDTYPKNKALGNYTTSNYLDMTFTGSVLTDNILIDTSAWCAQCHTRYLAAGNAPLPANGSRVDSGDAIFKFRHTSAGYSYKSYGPGTPTPVGPPVPTPKNRACITCHAVHGSNATAGVGIRGSGEIPDPGSTAPGSGSSNSKLLKMNNRGMCQKCHNK